MCVVYVKEKLQFWLFSPILLMHTKTRARGQPWEGITEESEEIAFDI